MKIYTKTGDDGTTGLIGGARAMKSSLRMCAIGDVDELNAAIGLARIHSQGTPVDELLSKIQNWLFDIGGELASPTEHRLQHRAVNDQHAACLERSMDEMTAALPPLANFILPGGSPLGAQLHFARCVCRRAERTVLTLSEEHPVGSELRVFLNRLSDWLFVAARTANMLAHVEDVAWTKSGV